MNPDSKDPYDIDADDRYSPERIKQAEAEAAQQGNTEQENDLAAEEQRARDDSAVEKENPVKHSLSERFRERFGNIFGKEKSPIQQGGLSNLRKYGLIGGLLSGVLFIVVIALMLLMFIGPYKVIHFATVLRSAGMARFTYQINRQFANVNFNAAVLTNESTGNIKLGQRSLIDVLRRVNPQKQLTVLGREGTVKFNFETECGFGCLKTTSQLKGVVVNGDEFSLDSITQDKYGKSFDDLSYREKVFVKNEFSKQLGSKLADRLAIENRAFRSSVFNGLRQVTGISMSKWANKARDYIGKTPEEAKAKNVQETMDRVSQGNNGRSASSEAIREAVEAKANPTDEAKRVAAGAARDKAVRMTETAGKASLAVLAMTTSCIAHDLHNSFDEIHANYEQQIARVGHDALTTADQIKSGDTTMEAVGAENSRWDNAENSVIYRQSTGQDVPENDSALAQLNAIPGDASNSGFAQFISTVDEILMPKNPLAFFIPAIGDIQDSAQNIGCEVVLNPTVQWITVGGETALTAVASFFSAGGAAAGKVAVQAGVETAIRGIVYAGAGVGVGEIIGRWIDSAVANLTSFTGAETGTSLYNNSAVGVNYLEQTGTRQVNYGKPLSADEAQATDQIALDYVKSTYSDGSINNRYFAVSNPYSLTSRLIPYLPSSAGEMASSIPKFIGSIFKAPASLFSNIFGGKKVSAATASATDFSGYSQQWGWTEDEYNRIDNDETYAPQALTDYYANHIDDTSGGQNLYSMYERCYDATLQKDIPSYCTSDFLSTDVALHWRYYQSMMLAADWMSSDDLGVRDAVVSNQSGSSDFVNATKSELQSSSEDIACAAGTTDVGIQDGNVNGNIVKVRLCAIPDLPSSDAESNPNSNYYIEGAAGLALVNSRASGTVLEMVKEMKAAGLNVAATSTFRTNQRQIDLRNSLGNQAAPPGKSNHQIGLAIDWRISPGNQNISSTCARENGYCKPPTDPYGIYAWLKENASSYGFSQYSEEFWHWEASAL